MRLREVAASRSGDKGDIVNICLFVYDPKDWDLVRERVTAQRVRDHFAPLLGGDVERYEVPSLHGVNFVLHGALAGGVSMSLRTDPHGKSFQSHLLDLEI